MPNILYITVIITIILVLLAIIIILITYFSQSKNGNKNRRLDEIVAPVQIQPIQQIPNQPIPPTQPPNQPMPPTQPIPPTQPPNRPIPPTQPPNQPMPPIQPPNQPMPPIQPPNQPTPPMQPPNQPAPTSVNIFYGDAISMRNNFYDQRVTICTLEGTPQRTFMNIVAGLGSSWSLQPAPLVNSSVVGALVRIGDNVLIRSQDPRRNLANITIFPVSSPAAPECGSLTVLTAEEDIPKIWTIASADGLSMGTIVTTGMRLVFNSNSTRQRLSICAQDIRRGGCNRLLVAEPAGTSGPTRASVFVLERN